MTVATRLPSSATLSLPRRSGAFALLMVAEFIYGWAWNSVDFLRPQIRAEFDLSLVEAGSLYTAQAAGALVGALVLGQLADRIGRRNLLVLILGAFGLLLAMAALAPNYSMLLVQRFGLGLALGGAQPVIASLYVGLFPVHVRGKLASLINAGFTSSMLGLGAGVALLGAEGEWREIIWIGAVMPLIAAPLMLFIPNDRRYAPYDDDAVDIADPGGNALPMRKLFAPGLRRFTLTLLMMAGLNYFAAQAFTGWTPTFLSEVRGFDPVEAGKILALQASGSLLGGFFWGWFGDRYGRRKGLIGYIGGAALMTAYLMAVPGPDALRFVSFGIGAMIAANVVWAPWMAEIFPDTLRATALSVFNWGRIVSLFAPLVTGAVAEQAGLASAMLLGPVALLIVALLWRSFPETLPTAQSRPESCASRFSAE
jgi:MFS family permease